jgi:hypothetical protein
MTKQKDTLQDKQKCAIRSADARRASVRMRFKLMFGWPEAKCRNAASSDSPNTINLGNALGKLKPKISPERAQHFLRQRAQED